MREIENRRWSRDEYDRVSISGLIGPEEQVERIDGHRRSDRPAQLACRWNEVYRVVPALLRVRGYRFFFYSMEGREPPHIHVAHAGRYAKFWLEQVALVDSRGFRGHELTEIREIRDTVREYRELFLEKWREYFGRQS